MLGLLLEGGGMRAGFVAGAVMALMDKGFAAFDLGLAVSASVPALAYFGAGQRREIERVWRRELNTPRLVRYSNLAPTSLAPSTKTPLVNLDYLIYDVLRARFPLRLDALRANPMRCHFAAAKGPEGALTLLRPDADDIYRIFKACLAVPGGYPGTVTVDGSQYLDGAVANPLPVRALLDQGAKRILAVLAKPLGREQSAPSLLEKAMLWKYFSKYEWVLERINESVHVHAEEVSLLRAMAKHNPPEAFVICPDEDLPMLFITRDPVKINRAVNLGYKKVVELEGRLREFLRPVETRPEKPVRPKVPLLLPGLGALPGRLLARVLGL